MMNNNNSSNPFANTDSESMWQDIMDGTFKAPYSHSKPFYFSGILTIDKPEIMAYITILKGKIVNIDCQIQGLNIYLDNVDKINNFLTFVKGLNQVMINKCNYE